MWRSEKEHRKAGKIRITRPVKLLIVLFACVLLVFLAICVINHGVTMFKNGGKSLADMITGEEGKTTTITKASLEKIFEINKLSTSDYSYSAIADAYEEDGTTVKYYVAYEGKVTAGIDFSKIDVEVDNEKKQVHIKLPACEILDTAVDFGSMDYIFKKDKYDSETVSQEAYALCEADLEQRAQNEKELLECADENAKDAVEAMVSPWIEQVDEEYTVDIQ